MPRVYYAHAICIYGRPDERKELSCIRKKIRRAKVINPARYAGHPEKQLDTVGFCLKLVDNCDVVVFSRLLGQITAGVGKEVNHALKTGKAVFELNGSEMKPVSRRVKYVSRAATRRLYREYRFSAWRPW